MQTIITTSGFIMVPPSGLTIVMKSLELVTLATSGTIIVSGDAGTLNKVFTVNGSTTIPLEVPFLQRENITVTPSVGTLVANYITAGEPDAMKYAYGVSWYSQTAPASGYHQRWVGSTSGTYQPVSGGFGG